MSQVDFLPRPFHFFCLGLLIVGATMGTSYLGAQATTPDETVTNDTINEDDPPPPDQTIPDGPLYNLANAYNHVAEPSPLHRPMAPHEFEALVAKGDVVLVVPTRIIEEESTERAQTDRLLEEVRRLIANPQSPGQRVDFLTALENISPGWSTRTTFQNNRKRQITVLLEGRDQIIRELMNSLSVFHSIENQKLIFENLRQRLVGTPAQIPVVELDTVTEAELKLINQQLLGMLETFLGRDEPAIGAPTEYDQCKLEEGSGRIGSKTQGDQSGPACSRHSKGLLNNSSWTLKFANTCVRNQGERDTSPAFAVTAAIESITARDASRYSNLSEQAFYNRQKLFWYKKPQHYGDGPNPLLTAGFSAAQGYQFHYEDIWHYNPSYGRLDVATPFPGYENSCENYAGRYCSDSNHQARRVCTEVGALRFCGYYAPMPIATPYRIHAMTGVLDLFNPESGTSAARALLRSGTPVVLNFAVPSQFLATGTNGYVAAPARGGGFLGAHALLLSGWVPNSRRPTGAPEGEGGGYFVAKNSWGSCTGDAGYYYLPYSFVKACAISVTAIF